MKRFFLYMVAAVCLISCNDKSNIWMNSITDIDSRVTVLEQLCAQMNTNIISLQTIVNALQGHDYVTSVTEIKEGTKVIGYTITFAKSPSITIYNGKDGKDGVDGKDGKDGITPIIGVAKDTDNVYYWTLNGEWLLDAQGNKIQAVGKDGKDGENGTNGTNGTNGITPQLKIESDYWYISYDNGTTWTQLGKAKGDKGDIGDKGDKGDSMFKSVTYDEDYVYLTLADDTIIKIPLGKSGEVKIEDGAIMAAFSISDSTKVYFSQGNLQYNAALGTHQCADGTTKQGTWRFAENQLDYVGFGNWGNVYYNDEKCKNELISSTYNGWIDLFAYGTSGWNSGVTCYEPWSVSTNHVDYIQEDLINTNQYADWGVYNAISNGGNNPNQWRTLNAEEWKYLLNGRNSHGHNRWQRASVDGIEGAILFPDDYILPSIFWGLLPLSENNELPITMSDWKELERNGAVFLVITRWRIGTNIESSGVPVYINTVNSNKSLYMPPIGLKIEEGPSVQTNRCGKAVRLVKEVE